MLPSLLLLPLRLVSPAHALTLDEAWAAADTHSVALQMIHEQRVQSDTQRTQAFALVSPKVVLGADYTVNQYETALDFTSMVPEQFQSFFEGSEPIVVNKKQYLSWNASVIQPIFSAQTLPLLKGVNDAVKAGVSTEDAQRAQIRAAVAQAWWGLLIARQGEAVATQALENANKHASIAKTGVAVGTAAPSVQLQADLGVARAERQVAVAHAGVVAAEEAFNLLTGLPKETPVEIPEPRLLPYTDVEAAVERAVHSRPDIDAARHQAHAAQMMLTASHLSWLPNVDGRLTEAYSGNSGFSGQEYNWQLVFSAKWTLWDGGARLADEAKSASQQRMAELQVESLERSAEQQVRSLWAEHARAETAVVAVQHEIELAEENLRIAEAAFGAGTITYLEVEDARVGLAASRMAGVQEAAERDITAIQLLESTGDL